MFCTVQLARQVTEMAVFKLLVSLSLLLLSSYQCNSKGVLYYREPQGNEDGSCPGQPNTIRPWIGEPVFKSKVENGSLYMAGEGDNQVYVAHVYGSPYSMGLAQGKMLKDQMSKILPAFYQHVEQEVEAEISFLPKELQELIAKYGLDGALDITYELTKHYIPQYFLDELKGVADGSGLDYKLILRVHMLPELVKAGCSMLGAWGKALSDPSGMIQLRALDWDVDGPLQQAPAAVVYHPDQGHPFINVGWTGWIASISGVSSSKIAISEKHSDMKFGGESRSGIPFNILMRDILQFDNSLSEALQRINHAHRTCSIWLGVGDGNLKTFRLVEYSESTAKWFDDKNVTQIDEDRFNREHCDNTCFKDYAMEDLVYWGVHLGCWNSILHSQHGHINVTQVINMVGSVQTGNLQAVVYDLGNDMVYVANAAVVGSSAKGNAYDRQFVRLDTKSLFSVPKPTM